LAAASSKALEPHWPRLDVDKTNLVKTKDVKQWP
jgi:hypothetical protein